MPPTRRSRSQSTAVPPRPTSSNSTASFHSSNARVAPYPRIVPATARPPHHLHEGQLSPIDHDAFARALQDEISNHITTTSMDAPAVDAHQHYQVPPSLQQQPPTVPIQYHTTTMDNEYNLQVLHPTIQRGAIPARPVEIRKPRQTTNQTNDNELKEMLHKNLHRNLDDLASDVKANERTSSAEKTKQLFAMIWLSQNLVKTKGSVPRTRVHTEYAKLCAKFHLSPLNPASFGKLVRVNFPDIQTRRLGVRGESKYHYVDLALATEMAAATASAASYGVSGNPPLHMGPPRPTLNLDAIPRFPPDSAVIPSEEQSLESPLLPSDLPLEAECRIFPVPHEPGFAPPLQNSKTYSQKLKFAPYNVMRLNDQEDIILPDVYLYTPPKTDVDAANSLATLYLTHATSLVDGFRYCREKAFFRLFTSFLGTMTVPVQKLLVHPDIIPWVKECDFIMYQKMIKVIAPLTLQVMPTKVMKFLNSVSKLLETHIARTFQGLPKNLLEAKLEPATLFCQLLERMLRANQAAHAAGATLINDENRIRMWTEYVKFVQPKSMMNAFLPDCGYDEDIYKLLTYDIRYLLLPLPINSTHEIGTHYESAAIAQNTMAQPCAFELDYVGEFIDGLRLRFSAVSSRDLLHYIHGITSHILRDITMENGASYNSWLITKCFVDELALWLVHVGGFLERPTQPPPRRLSSTTPDTGRLGDPSGAEGFRQILPKNTAANLQQNGMSYESNSMVSFIDAMVVDQMPTAQPPPAEQKKGEMDLDDSGIGLSLLHETTDLSAEVIATLGLPEESAVAQAPPAA